MKFIETGRTRSDVKRKVQVMVDDKDFDYLNQFYWQADKDNAVATHKNGERQRTLIHRLILNAPSHLEVDHIDGNRLNNQRSNLRLCNSSENKCNRGPRKDNKSGYKGVSWHKQNQKWTVRLQIPSGRYLSLGCYHDIKEAATAYNEAAKKYHGEFAFLNQL
jgi:hypothetical protein